MNKTIVVYSSNYGSTKTYAQYISEVLQCKIVELSEIKIKDLSCFDNIIFGGGLYAGGILGIKFIAKNFYSLESKRIIVFTVGLSDPTETEKYQPIIKKAFNKQQLNKIKFFHLRGAINYKELSFLHKTMMKMLKKKVEQKKIKTNEDIGILNTYGKNISFINKTSIKPLIEYVSKEIL